MSANKIEPCPFCGSDKVHVESKLHWNDWSCSAVWCDTCGACGPLCKFKVEAIEKWNKLSVKVAGMKTDGQDGPAKSAAESKTESGSFEAYGISTRDVPEDLRCGGSSDAGQAYESKPENHGGGEAPEETQVRL